MASDTYMTATKGKRQRNPENPIGKRAIVLGAREGNIGGAIAERLCTGGWVAHEDDCSDYDQIDGETVYLPPMSDELERYDACVITLGTTHMEPFSKVGRTDLHDVLYGCLELPLECARRYVHSRKSYLPNTEFRGHPVRGTVVFMGSYAHDHPFTHCSSYCAAKAGLNMAAQALAWELMPEGFDVHIVNPHHVQGTPMTDEIRRGMQTGVHRMTPQGAEAYQRKDLRMPDILTPREIAEMVYLLLTTPVARWLSGQPVNMYGGVR